MGAKGEVKRILVITAHPDDCDFGAAGTIAQWTDSGIEVSYCIITDGQAGGFDPSVPRSEMPKIRRREQTNAGAAVGVTDITFLGYMDGELTVTHELRRDLTRVIRQKRPDRVLTLSPERNWDRIHASHPDHLAAGEAALCAVYPDSRNQFAHISLLEEEGLEPHTVPEVWLTMAGDKANHFVDISKTIDRKFKALQAHESQMEDEWKDLEARLREWAGENARLAGFPDGAFAESFLRISTE